MSNRGNEKYFFVHSRGNSLTFLPKNNQVFDYPALKLYATL